MKALANLQIIRSNSKTLTAGNLKNSAPNPQGLTFYRPVNIPAYLRQRYWPGMRLARDGAKVAISYQASADGANAAVEEIGGDGGHAIAVQADLTKSDDVQKLVRTTQEAFGQQIDVLIHVTGGLIARKSIEEMDEAHWQRVMDLNATSLFRMVKAVTPYMPDGGAIVAFASQAGRALLPTPPRKALS